MILGWVETLSRQTTPTTKSGWASAIETAATWRGTGWGGGGGQGRERERQDGEEGEK